eukprot:CAMPEP_0117432142 /NCGR_PEP_ID=MMETSP0758-20121206/11683_1 /TAXON_ID=63605 /ORGANISM="Percolomonas cosmopolitus, Strain AE-1 (ATCC 50343)" /LENGTH=85 /DNA_ID=CAMNT_0005221869 /DNA_START=272 /DNA_END=525 /DNA_ORIENTATION=-
MLNKDLPPTKHLLQSNDAQIIKHDPMNENNYAIGTFATGTVEFNGDPATEQSFVHHAVLVHDQLANGQLGLFIQYETMRLFDKLP